MQAPISVKRENTSEHEGKCTKGSHWNVSLTTRVHVREKGGTKEKAPRDLDMGPHIRLPAKDQDERRPGGAGRPCGPAEPGQPSVQVHFDVE